MGRPDLLALTDDDLAALANVGLVRRARRELDAGTLTWTLVEEGDGTLVARWSDGPSCTLPRGGPTAWRCDCPATALCRHLLRTVLAYRERAADPGPASGVAPARDAADERDPGAAWNPGLIDDEEVGRLVQRATLARARRLAEAGQVVEVARGAKPLAQLHTLGVATRFLVPGSAAYTRCTCADEAPCVHVPLAIWAFRHLDPARPGGVVALGPAPAPAPDEPLDALERALAELATSGLAGAPRALLDRLRRLEARCRAAALVWPAEIVAELVEEIDRYAAGDARFDPPLIPALVGELRARGAAIRADTGALPARYIRGIAATGPATIGGARFIGLGSDVRAIRRGLTLTAYLHDPATGGVVAVDRASRALPEPPPPDAVRRLADTAVGHGVTVGQLAAGQLLVARATRTPGGRLTLGRATPSATPQPYAWEHLAAPTLAEDFAELGAWLAGRPPGVLRPRVAADTIHVCAVAGATDVAFSTVRQAIVATIRDHAGGVARLVHPYTTMGAAGCEATLAALAARGDALCFVAGRIALAGALPVVRPIGLVFEGSSGREFLQPWLAQPAPGLAPTVRPAPSTAAPPATSDDVAAFADTVLDALAELFVVGLARADGRRARDWARLRDTGAALGFVRLVAPIDRLARALAERDNRFDWEAHDAAAAMLELALLARLAAEPAVATPSTADMP